MCTNRARDVRRGKVCVVLFCHARVSVSELLCYDGHWYAAHRKRRRRRPVAVADCSAKQVRPRAAPPSLSLPMIRSATLHMRQSHSPSPARRQQTSSSRHLSCAVTPGSTRANADGSVDAGNGVASGRIGRQTPIHVADTILTGVHQLGESHFELLEAFTSDAVLAKISEAFSKHSYRSHEFGDLLLIERSRGMPRR